MQIDIILAIIIAACFVGLAFLSGYQHGARLWRPRKAVDLDKILQQSRHIKFGETISK